MKLGIDCISVDPLYKGGVNTYIFGLLDGFSCFTDSGTEIEFTIFCTSHNQASFKKYTKYSGIKIVIIDSYRTMYRKLFMLTPFVIGSSTLWKIFNDLYVSILGIKDTIENNCDLLYTPTTTLKFYNLDIPTVLSMHDIQQYHYPEFFSKKELRLRRLTFENSAKTATYIQASSYFIKNDLLEHFVWLNPEQIVVIPEGVNLDEYGNCVEDGVLEKYNLPNNFLFFPAQLWRHKNHITVLRALKKIENNNHEKIPMVMTGAKYSSSDEVLNFIKENNMNYVYYLGKVNFTDLLCLYKEAKFLITAVLYESSSLPILEAAASSTPIIASATPPNIEISKNLIISLFDPLDVGQCSDIIRENWKQGEELIDKQVAGNRREIQFFSWKNIALKYLDFFKERSGRC
jgi:glycosyltransferase involved in cell wall biosynthesis